MKSILDKFLLRILDYEIPAILVGKQSHDLANVFSLIHRWLVF